MSLTSNLKSGVRLAAVTPVLWIYGVIAAALGGAIMISGLLVAVPRTDDPVGHGLLGWAVLAGVMIVSITIEAAACRAAVRRSGLGAAALDAGRLLPSGVALAPVVAIMGVLFGLMVAVPVFTFLRSILAAILLVVFPFAVDMTIIIGSFAAALALIVPVWMFIPLAVRGIGIHDRDPWESIGDALSILGERPGATFLLSLLCIGVDLILLFSGARFGARDLTLPGRLHVLASWTGTHFAAGAVILGFVAVCATVKAGVWTAFYLDVAQKMKWGDSEREPAAHGSLVQLGILARKALRHLSQSSVPFVIAAVVVLIGMPAVVDLLTIYHLVPGSIDPSLSHIAKQIPGGESTLFKLFIPALMIVFVCWASLVVATESLANQKRAGLGETLITGARKMFSMIGAQCVMIAGVALVGIIVLVGVLFAMALLVQFARGLNGIADQFGQLVAILIFSVALIMTPFVIRASVFENLSPSAAAGRALDLATAQPWLVLLAFLFTISLEVLCSPIAHWRGLITSGWSELYALSGRVHPPIARGKLLHSALTLLASVFAVAFQAQLWTEVYNSAAAEFARMAATPEAATEKKPRRFGRKKKAGVAEEPAPS